MHDDMLHSRKLLFKVPARVQLDVHMHVHTQSSRVFMKIYTKL